MTHKETFENYLQAVHYGQSDGMAKDALVEDFERWITELDADTLIKHAEAWGEAEKEKMVNRITNVLN